jgi:Mg2+ and Co2+ transporter CorA
MNVLFPGEHTHPAFWVIVGLMIGVIVATVGFFRFKRWL